MKTNWRTLLLRQEIILLLVLIIEWNCFNMIGRHFGSLDNTFDIVRHTVEIGLLALVMTPIILTGGIDLSGNNVSTIAAKSCSANFGVMAVSASAPLPPARCWRGPRRAG